MAIDPKSLPPQVQNQLGQLQQIQQQLQFVTQQRTQIDLRIKDIEHSLEDTKTPNIVTAVLADYRGYDTLGETIVIFTAGLACVLILMKKGH